MSAALSALFHPDAWRRQPGAATAALVLAVAPLLGMVDALALAPLLGVLAVGLLIGARRDRGADLRPTKPPLSLGQAGLLALFLAWMAASLAWAPDPRLALKTLAMTLGAVAAGLVVAAQLPRLPADGLARCLAGLTGGLVVALALLLAVQVTQRFLVDPAGPYAHLAIRLAVKMDRGTTFAALFLWAPVLWAWRRGRRGRATGLMVLAFLAILPSRDLAAKVSLFVGLALIGLAAWRPRRTAGALGLAMAVAIIVAPLAAGALPEPEHSLQWRWLPNSAHHRMTIWRFAGQTIAARPLLGHGLEAARQAGGGLHLILVDPAGLTRDEELMPLHPHDASLHVWLELGAVGALLLAGFVALLGRRIAAAAGPWQPAAVAGFGVAFVVCSVSYGFWQSWWQSSMWLAGGLLLALGRGLPVAAEAAAGTRRITPSDANGAPPVVDLDIPDRVG